MITINKAATQALISVMKNEATFSLGLTDCAAGIRKCSVTVWEQRQPAALAGKGIQEAGMSPVQAGKGLPTGQHPSA